MNRFSSKSDDTIATAATTAAAVLSQNEAYHVPKATADALALAGSGLAAHIDASKTAQDAAKAATLEKLSHRESALAALTTVANIVYTNGTSDSMIQALGFSPRAGVSRPVAPTPVAGLTATVLEGGAIRLDFKRSGNRASAIFQIERSLDAGATWAIVASIGGTKATLTGYAAGVPVLFRITTTNSVGNSLPSNVASAYVGETESSAPVELKLAA